MELPISAQSYRPPSDALVRAIERADVMHARMMAQETELGGATAFTNPDRPLIHMANCVYDLQLREDDEAEALLGRLDAHFADAGVRCYKLHSAAMQWPEAVARGLERRGYRAVEHLLHILDAFTPPDPARLRGDLQIIPGRAAYTELRRFYEESGASCYGMGDDEANQFADAMIDRLDEPRVEMFLGRISGEPVGRVAVNSVGQIGIIDDVYTRADRRGQGIATTLIVHALEFCKRAIFEQVILETDGKSEPIDRLYARLGFQKVTRFKHYRLESAM